jgi:hypothetical protein
MKKIILLLITWFIFQCSCTRIQDGPPSPTTPPCDNTVANCVLQLDWYGTSYLCTIGSFGITTPPNATAFNYLGTASVNGTIGSLSSPSSYLCQIISKNDEPAANPYAACTNPGTMTSTWAVAGASQNIKIYKNANTDITVDYYDVCGSCNGAISQGRPYFSGKIVLPPGAIVGTVNLQTQDVYVGSAQKPCE